MFWFPNDLFLAYAIFLKTKNAGKEDIKYTKVEERKNETDQIILFFFSFPSSSSL